MQGEGYCGCGCGLKTRVAPKTRGDIGWIKGRPLRFIHGHQNRVGRDLMARFERSYLQVDCGFETPCWVWQEKVTPNGYAQFTFHDLGVNYNVVAHRWLWKQEHGDIQDGLQLDHLCEVRACVNPTHLELVTPLENVRRSRSAKLTQAQAEDIYARRTSGESAAQIAADFNVSKTLVYVIAKNGPHGPRRPEQNARHRANNYPSASSEARARRRKAA